MATRKLDVPLAVYVDGNTAVHRLNPSLKILLVVSFIVASNFILHSIPWALGSLLVVAGLFLWARIPLRVAWGQLWPPLTVLVPLTLFQWWNESLGFALERFLFLLAAMALAFLLTLTSTVNQILESIEHSLAPLERIGVPVATIALAMALTIRLIPLMFQTVYEVLDARKARGASFSPAAFGIPVLIKSMRRAQAMGEALAARGVGD